jgi:folylpolyglutamate synthase/dihydropteroate synthase
MKALFSNQYIRVSLKDLMEKYPGTYISMACRKVKDLEGHEDTLFDNAVEEIYLRRLPYMNNDQQEKMLKHYSEINTTNSIYKTMKAPKNAALGISRKRATLKQIIRKNRKTRKN